ncbi:MAG: OmpA family protein [Microscillaceae bacterium]|nr:OmpA family protein [Microscillaceae bacterium]
MNKYTLLCLILLWVIKVAFAQKADVFNQTINTDTNDKNPSLSADGKTLIFCSDREHGFGGNLKLYHSQKDQDGYWLPPSPIKWLNDTLEDSFKTIHTCLTANGQHLYFSGKIKGRRSRDIALATRKDSTWIGAELLPSPINTDWEETSPSISSDGNTLYFIRFKENMEEEYKTYDGGKIYVTHRLKDQPWSEPKPLPLAVNATPAHTVYLLPDAKTIIFSTERAGGKGGLDFYQSELQKNGSWSNPVNLYHFNTLFHDSAIAITTDKSGIYLSNDNVKNSIASNYNLYQIVAHQFRRVSKEIKVSGRILQSQTQKPIQATIRISQPFKDSTAVVINSNKIGEYQIILKDREVYFMVVEAEGHLAYKSYFDLANLEDYDNIHQDIELLPASNLFEEGERIVLQNITFEYNSAVLNPLALLELEKVMNYLLDYPQRRLEIAARTDNEGTKQQNMLLSNQRAQAVVSFLVKKGIAFQRLFPMGYGDTKPLATNNTADNKRLNRRVEFRLME